MNLFNKATYPLPEGVALIMVSLHTGTSIIYAKSKFISRLYQNASLTILATAESIHGDRVTFLLIYKNDN